MTSSKDHLAEEVRIADCHNHDAKGILLEIHSHLSRRSVRLRSRF